MNPSHEIEGCDVAAFISQWWEKADVRRLPGEDGGHTVFVIEFWDGCRVFDHTAGGVMARVADLGCGPVDHWRDEFVSEHVAQTVYAVRCIASNLEAEDARALRDLLVSEAPGDVRKSRGRAVEVRGCPLGKDPVPAVSMTFGEWVKSRGSGIERGNTK